MNIASAISGAFALFLILGLVGALMSGATASWLASTKGHGEVAWFVLGMLFGPIAWIVVGLSGENHKGSGWGSCGACREPVRAGATRCPHCTINLV